MFFNSYILVSPQTLFIVSTVVLINIICIVYKRIDEAIANTFNDCNIFEKAEQLSPLLYVEAEEQTSFPISRFAQFIYFERARRLNSVYVWFESKYTASVY